jgi:hypothetical protein
VQVLEHYGADLGAEGQYQDSVKEQVMAVAPEGLKTDEYQQRATAATKKKSLSISFFLRTTANDTVASGVSSKTITHGDNIITPLI